MVSIIVPVHNVAQYIHRCVHSLLAQTHSDIEIILVENCSTDNSYHICTDLASKHTNIVFSAIDVPCVSAARNRGIDIARGQYLCFVDSDDFVAPEMVEILLHACETTGADIAQSSHLYTSSDTIDTAETPDIPNSLDITVLEGQAPHWSLAGAYGIVRAMPWGKLFKRKVFDQHRFPQGMIHEDEAIMHHLLLAGNKVASVDAKTYFYYTRPGSIMNETFNTRRYDVLKALQDRIDAYDKLGWDKLSFITALRLHFTIMEYRLLTAQHLPHLDKEQHWLKAEYEKLLPSILNSPYADDETKTKHQAWLNTPDRGQDPFAFRYVRRWLAERKWFYETN